MSDLLSQSDEDFIADQLKTGRYSSRTELLGRAIALLRKSLQSKTDSDQDIPAPENGWKEAWTQTAGIWADRDDIDDFLAENRERAKQRFSQVYDKS